MNQQTPNELESIKHSAYNSNYKKFSVANNSQDLSNQNEKDTDFKGDQMNQQGYDDSESNRNQVNYNLQQNYPMTNSASYSPNRNYPTQLQQPSIAYSHEFFYNSHINNVKLSPDENHYTAPLVDYYNCKSNITYLKKKKEKKNTKIIFFCRESISKKKKKKKHQKIPLS